MTGAVVTEDPLYTQAEASAVDAQRLSFDWSIPAQIQSVALGGVLYRVRAVYRARLGSWYIDLLTQGGEPILLGRRVTPGWGINLTHHPEAEPLGLLMVARSVPDPYRRDAFGRELTITFYPLNRLKVLPPDEFAGIAVDLG